MGLSDESMREKIEHIIWFNSNINDHAIDITTDTIMKEILSTDMRENIADIVCGSHKGVSMGYTNDLWAADAIMKTLTGETTHGKSQK
jgi:hypothetical protein